MPSVFIDGVEFVPRSHVSKSTNMDTLLALQELVSIHYFGEKRKFQAISWNALNLLDPELASLVDEDPSKAWNKITLQIEGLKNDQNNKIDN